MDTASNRMVGGRLVPELFHLDSELTDGEGGTGLVDTLQLAVTNDVGIGIVLFQREESLLLG